MEAQIRMLLDLAVAGVADRLIPRNFGEVHR
jgi:hypothetical protein